MEEELKKVFPGSKFEEKDGKTIVHVNIFKLLDRKISIKQEKEIEFAEVKIYTNNPNLNMPEIFKVSLTPNNNFPKLWKEKIYRYISRYFKKISRQYDKLEFDIDKTELADYGINLSTGIVNLQNK